MQSASGPVWLHRRCAMTVLDQPVSLFTSVFDKGAPWQSPPLAQTLNRIQRGVWQKEITQLRLTLQSKGEDAYRIKKSKLMAMTPACAMTLREGTVPLSERVASVSQIIHYDLDHVPDPDRVKALLRQNPPVAFVFTSPRGHGLKIGIAAEGVTVENYKRAWELVLRDLKSRYPDGEFVEDAKIKYINALCFVSYDPHL